MHYSSFDHAPFKSGAPILGVPLFSVIDFLSKIADCAQVLLITTALFLTLSQKNRFSRISFILTVKQNEDMRFQERCSWTAG